MQSISRRTLLGKTLLGSAALALPGATRLWARDMAGPQPGASLKAAGAAHGITVGCEVQSEQLQNDPGFRQLVLEQFGSLVAGFEMKFGALSTSPGVYDFSRADYLVDFAKANELKMRGHTLVWHRKLPDWIKGYATRTNVASILQRHIHTVAGRYQGQIQSWDVVNEALELKDQQPGGFRKSLWYELMGPEYVDLAYRTARAADPKAKLTYNDYGIENDDPGSDEKRKALLDLLRGFRRRGVPIDAVGIQAHMYAKPRSPFGEGLRELIRKVRALDLDVYVTELDVNDNRLEDDDASSRDAAVAAVYEAFLACVLEEKAVSQVLTWGVTDRWTWLNDFEKDVKLHPNRKERCLLYDEQLQPKPAYYAMLRALKNAPSKA